VSGLFIYVQLHYSIDMTAQLGRPPASSPAGNAPTATASVGDALEGYIHSLVADGKSDHTRASTRLDLNQLARFLGRQRLSAVSTDDLRRFFQWLQRQQGNAPSSLRRKTSSVKGFFRFLHASGAIDTDPSEAIIYPPAGVASRPPLTREEAAQLVAAAPSPLWRAVVICLLDCGLKRDEVVALLWEDVDRRAEPAPGVVHVRHRRASKRARRRTLSLTSRLVRVLETCDRPESTSAAVFPLSARGVDFVVETCASRAHVRPGEKVTPQMLRDTYARDRMAGFVQAEAGVIDPTARRDLEREHDALLLRELGLARESAVAGRIRLMVQQAQADRSE
jgi:site-specific recombinase XerD